MTELPEGGAAGFDGRHARSEICLRRELDVRLKFIIELALDLPAAEERLQAKEKLPEPVHARLPALRSWP